MGLLSERKKEDCIIQINVLFSGKVKVILLFGVYSFFYLNHTLQNAFFKLIIFVILFIKCSCSNCWFFLNFLMRKKNNTVFDNFYFHKLKILRCYSCRERFMRPWIQKDLTSWMICWKKWELFLFLPFFYFCFHT